MDKLFKLGRLTFTGLITGYIISILLGNWTWLAMRVDIGLAIPVCCGLGAAAGLFAGRPKGFLWAILPQAALIVVFTVTYWGRLDALYVIPAVFFREGFRLDFLSVAQINLVLAVILIIGNGLWLVKTKDSGSGLPEPMMLKAGRVSDIKTIFRDYKGKVLVFLLVIAIYFLVPGIKDAVNQAVAVLSKVDVDAVKSYILGFGIWAPIVSFLLMVLQSIAAPLPAFIITFANAGLFGWIYGAILSWSSAMAGAVLCFYIARFLGRDLVEKITSRTALERVDEFFKHYGKYAILIARLLPFVSFDIVSYAAGLTSMSFWSFFIATGIGQLPATIVYSYIGGMLTGTARTFVFGLLMFFALSTLIILLKQVWKDKSKAGKELAVENR